MQNTKYKYILSGQDNQINLRLLLYFYGLHGYKNCVCLYILFILHFFLLMKETILIDLSALSALQSCVFIFKEENTNCRKGVIPSRDVVRQYCFNTGALQNQNLQNQNLQDLQKLQAWYNCHI